MLFISLFIHIIQWWYRNIRKNLRKIEEKKYQIWTYIIDEHYFYLAKNLKMLYSPIKEDWKGKAIRILNVDTKWKWIFLI